MAATNDTNFANYTKISFPHPVREIENKKVLSTFVLPLLLFLVSCSGTGGTIRDEQILKAKSWYDEKVASFQKENDSLRAHPDSAWKTQIVLLGDSFTERFDHRRSFSRLPVLNRGISSDHIEWDALRGIVHRLSPETLAPNPSHIVLLVGVNDLGDDNSAPKIASYIEGYGLILRELNERYPSAHIAVCSLLPAGGRFARLNDAIREFNLQLHDLSRKTQTRFVDLYPLYADSLGQMRSSYTSDGLHIKAEAYALWIDALRDFLGASTEPPRNSR